MKYVNSVLFLLDVEYIRNILFFEEENKENERRKIFGEGKIFGLPRRRRTKKANEETIWSIENKKNGKGKRGKSIGERKCRYGWTHDRKTGRQNCEDRAKILTQNSQ